MAAAEHQRADPVERREQVERIGMQQAAAAGRPISNSTKIVRQAKAPVLVPGMPSGARGTSVDDFRSRAPAMPATTIAAICP